MSLQRDLVWKYLENLYKSSVSHQFARYALALSYESLPPEVVHQAKRCLLDALGCAIGAYEAPGRPICEAVVRKLGGIEESTVIGSGIRTTAANATIVNSFLVRFLDFNDYGGGGHISDSIPGVLAVAEREKTNGRDFLTSLVIPYELGERFVEAMAHGPGQAEGEVGGFALDFKAMPGFREVGAGLIMPAALGKLMKLSEEQIANAIGICACHSVTLAVVDADREECFMSKNLRYGWSSYKAILACMLAKEGFTGPIRVVEGQHGIEEVVFRDKLNLQKLLDFSGWRILKTRHKALPVCAGIIGQALATIALVKENDLKPDEIAAVNIKTAQPLHHTTYLPKKYPRNAESADHSTYFIIAAAIKERKVDPETVEPKKFTDAVILDLIEKIALEVDPKLSPAAAIVTITTQDGRSFRKEIANSFGNDPLTDGELEEKFKQMAIKYLPEKHIKKIFDTIWNLESLNDVGKLMALLVFKP